MEKHHWLIFMLFIGKSVASVLGIQIEGTHSFYEVEQFICKVHPFIQQLFIRRITHFLRN